MENPLPNQEYPKNTMERIQYRHILNYILNKPSLFLSGTTSGNHEDLQSIDVIDQQKLQRPKTIFNWTTSKADILEAWSLL